MTRSAHVLLAVFVLGTACFAQKPATPAPAPAASGDKSNAYYHFAMGRLYAELGQMQGSKANITKAIQNYELALKEDPSATVVLDELTELYVATNRLQDAMSMADELLKQNPDNIAAHRMLARIYSKAISNGQTSGINEDALRKALAEYQKIVKQDPKDVESWVMVGNLNSVIHNVPEAEGAFGKALEVQPDSEEALLGLANLYGQLGDPKRAAEKLKAFTEKNPSAATLTALARAYKELEEYKSAADTLRKAMELAPDDDQIPAELAEMLLYSDQVDEALGIYEKLSTENPRNPEFELRLCAIYLTKHDIPKARAAIEKAKQIAPSNLQVRYEEVSVLEGENNMAAAVSTMKNIVDELGRRSGGDPKSRLQFINRLAILYRANNQFTEAAETFRQAATIDPAVAPQETAEIIETYRAAKDTASAQKEANAALKLFPKDSSIIAMHATVMADAGKIDEAAAELRSLSAGKPTVAVQLQLAQIYEKGKRYADMAKAIDGAEAVAKDPRERESIFFMRGAMFEHDKKYAAAEAEFRKVLVINPENAGTLNYLGYMLADQNMKLDEASDMVKKALALDPGNGAFMDSLGWVYYRQGKFSDAEGLLVKALEKQKDATVHDHLGDVYIKQGKTREAVAQWQASLAEYNAGDKSETDADEMAKVTQKLQSAQALLAKH